MKSRRVIGNYLDIRGTRRVYKVKSQEPGQGDAEVCQTLKEEEMRKCTSESKKPML